MVNAPEPYPFLRQLIGSWFHQDFDIDGETLEDILSGYKSVTEEEQILGVKAEIEKFIEESGDKIDDRFIELFRPDVDPAGWGMTTKEWLTQIHDIL